MVDQSFLLVWILLSPIYVPHNIIIMFTGSEQI